MDEQSALGISNSRLTPAERYHRDPVFHRLVDLLRSGLKHAEFTATELREAVLLAAEIHENETIRPLIIRKDW